MTRPLLAFLTLCALAAAACHPEPVISMGGRPPVRGTIAGTVTSDAKTPLEGRRVTAIDTTSGARFDVTTGTNGGYTIQVPDGTYRLEVEVRAGERVIRQPAETRINRSDLDAQRDFVIGGGGIG